MDKKNDMKLKRVVKSSPLKKLILSNPISIVSQMMLNPSYKVIQLPNDTFKTSLTVKSGTYFGYGQSIKTSKAAAAKAVLNDILKKFIQRKTQTDNNEQQQLINDANYDINDISSGHILAYMMDFYLESAGKNNTYVVQKDDLSHSEPVQAVRQKFPGTFVSVINNILFFFYLSIITRFLLSSN